jgi:hypothetical protein
VGGLGSGKASHLEAVLMLPELPSNVGADRHEGAGKAGLDVKSTAATETAVAGKSLEAVRQIDTGALNLGYVDKGSVDVDVVGPTGQQRD